MKKALFIFSLIILVFSGFIFLLSLGPSACVAKKEIDFIVIDREKGIKDLCHMDYNLGYAISQLGKEDRRKKGNGFWLGYDYQYHYDKHGLMLLNFGGTFFPGSDIDLIEVTFDKATVKNIRFFDNKPLTHPLYKDKVIKLYGPPAEEEKEKGKFRLNYQFEKSKYSFFGKDNIITSLNMTDR